MTISSALGYAFLIALPPAIDRQLREWTDATPGASSDFSGAHVTLARFTGSRAPEQLIPAFHRACSGFGAFDAGFTVPAREDYWDKPGMEIVMLLGEAPEDIAGVMALRARLLAELAPEGVTLTEGGLYRPHVTLTTGLPPEEALALEAAAAGLELRFTAHEVVFWAGGETTEGGAGAGPPWHAVERVLLL